MENLTQFIPLAGWIIFGAVAVFFTVISIILNYHWTRYGVGGAWLKKVRTIYFGFGGVALAAMLVLALLLSK